MSEQHPMVDMADTPDSFTGLTANPIFTLSTATDTHTVTGSGLGAGSPQFSPGPQRERNDRLRSSGHRIGSRRLLGRQAGERRSLLSSTGWSS